MMQIAVPTWKDRVSPVFDSARNLLLVEVDGGREIGRTWRSIHAGQGPSKVNELSSLGINVLICGAITRRLADMCDINGIRVIPWISGPTEEVIQAFLAGALPQPAYTMPGCCKRRRRARRGRGRGGRNSKRWK